MGTEALDAKIALGEAKLRLLREQVDFEWRKRFVIVMAQSLSLWEGWPECKGCKKGVFIQEFCLESRQKTGRCIFEVGVENLEEMPWPACREAKK